jgi:hypothetical protein
MKIRLKLTALVVAAAMLFAVAGVARADDRYAHRRGPSTTEKVIAGVATAAIVGLAAYALTRDKNRHHRTYYHGPRSYVAVSVGFQSYNGHRFWRVPYVYNPHYDQAFNAGWERGYWAGYLQGRHDSRMRAAYYDRFQWNQRGHMWGYGSGHGRYSSYERAFHMAFRAGYRHGFRGYRYGSEGFGFRVMTRR